MDRSFDDADTLFEDMAANNYQWNPNRTPQRRTAGVYEIDVISALTAQVHALTKQLAQSGIHTPQETMASCDLCGGNHVRKRCGLNVLTLHNILTIITGNKKIPTQIFIIRVREINEISHRVTIRMLNNLFTSQIMVL